MRFEWDEEKRRRNVRKHGIDFVDAAKVFDGHTVRITDDRFDYDEERFITFGLLRYVPVAIGHTENETTIRIISARKATKRETATYFSSIPD